MDVSITDISDVEKEVKVHATAEELVPHFEKAYRQQLPKIELRGFRKGKAPLEMVKKLYGEAIEYDSLDGVANDMYREVIRTRDIHPIGDPVLTDINYQRGQALTFTIKYQVKPHIELREYKGLALEKIIHRVSDEEVENEILRLRRANATLSPAESAADDEHIVTADIQQLDASGNPLIGRKTEDTRLYLADEGVYEEIRQALRSAGPGSTPRATITVRENEKEVTNFLEIHVKKVEKVNLPALDEEFVKKITKGKVTTIEEFRKNLRADITGYWQERSERKLVDQLITEIVRRHEFNVPGSIVDTVLDSLVEELRNRSPQKKLPEDFDEKEFREKNRGYGIFQSRWYLLRESIIEAEKIAVDDADIARTAERDSPAMGIDKDRLLTFYQSSQPVKDRILSEKLMTWLKEKCRITENVTDEFFE